MPPRQPPASDKDRRLSIADELVKLKATKGWAILMLALEQHLDAAKNELVDADPADVAKIEGLQREAKRYIWFYDTIEDLIAQGLDITMADQEPEQEDGQAEREPDTGD